MNKLIGRLIITLFCLIGCATLTLPDEGMWLMVQLDKLPFEDMRHRGLELSRQDLYNPGGTSLKDAVVLLPGGTGSFVSAEGLIITNHHIAFSAIQSVSSVQDDYLKNGFVASAHSEEISVPSYTASIVDSIKDVTDEILSAVSDIAAPEARAKAIQKKIADVQRAAKGTSEIECTVSETFSGVKYYLYCTHVIRDLRLVYAPPSSIGNYGGEVDNWYWPRHTGDFGFMRAYVAPDGKAAKFSKDNVPYRPKKFLPISSKPLDEHSFAMIMGYPGRTFRYATSPEIKLSKEETLPLTINIYRTRMDVMEAAGKKDRAVEIKYATAWRQLANTYKKYEGVLEGMTRSGILDKRRDEERRLDEFIHSKPDLGQKYGTVLPEIARAYDTLKTFNRKQIVLNQIGASSDILRISRRFRTYAQSFEKDSTGKMSPRGGSADLKQFLENAFKDLDLAEDKAELQAVLLKSRDLPEGERIESLRGILGDRAEEMKEKSDKFLERIYKESKLTTPAGCNEMLGKEPGEILDDEFVKFAQKLEEDNAPLQSRVAAFNAKIGLLRSKLLQAMMAWKGSALYPDANRTLRITYGEVKSFDPRDGVHYDYETSLGGVIEKETGEDPFIVPQRLHDLSVKKDYGPYADPRLHDVPVAFIADLDITGGNSGSPVINGKGELIGVAFDGNWEAVVGDYIYQEPLNRSINVESRYVLFLLDKFSNAQNIMKELVIHGESPGKTSPQTTEASGGRH